MKNSKNIILLIFVLYISACSNEYKNEATQDTKIFKKSGLIEKLDTLNDFRSLFDEKKITLLLPSTITIGKIGFIYDTDLLGNIYLCSRTEVYKFSSEGKYLNTLATVGKGPGEYISIDAISFDNKNNIYVFDGTEQIINIYDKDFTFVDKIAQKSHTPLSDVKIDNENLYVYCPLDRKTTIYQYNLKERSFVRAFGQVDSLYIKYHSNLAFGSLSVLNNNIYFMPVHSAVMYVYDKSLNYKQIKFKLKKFVEIKKANERIWGKKNYSYIHRFDIFKNLFIIQTKHPNIQYPIKAIKIDIADLNGKIIKEQLIFSGILKFKKINENQFMSVKYLDNNENPSVFIYTLKKNL